MSWYQNVYWWGSVLQGLVMLALLVNIWRKKDCSGISLRSQILYALVFTTRHPDFGRYHIPLENWFIKAAYIILTYGTVLSIWKYLSNSYEKQHDKARIDIWIPVCAVLSLIFNERFDYLLILMAFSMYIEAIAMIPQFQMILETKRLEKHVILYIAGMALYSLLLIIFLCNQNGYYSRRGPYEIVAATAQFLAYCEFFRRIYPLMDSEDGDVQRTPTSCPCFNKIYHFLRSEKPKDVEAVVVEDEAPKTGGHLASNVSSVVLTPSSLAGVHKEKGSFDY